MDVSNGMQRRRSPIVVAAAPLAPQLSQIRARCREVSLQHRLAMPHALVRARLGELTQKAAALFEERVIEICFLIDQYGTLRYGELRDMLDAISTRTLASKLSLLHREGFVERTVYPEGARRVEYTLTERGHALADVLFSAMLVADRPGAEP